MWIPFIIFFLGYSLTWRKSQSDKRKDVFVYRDLFIEWVKLAENRTIQQAENCFLFSKNLREGLYIDAEKFGFAPLMYEKLNSINQDKVISAFVFNITSSDDKKLKHYNRLISNINFLDRIGSELKEKYEKSSQDLRSLSNEFNKSLDNLDKLHLSKVNEIGDEVHHDDGRYIKILGDFKDQWSKKIEQSDFGFTATHTFNNLVEPSIDFVKKSFAKDKKNKFLLDMYNELTDMIIISKKWEAYKTGHSEIFENYGNAIIESYSDLKKSILYFQEKTQVLPYWKVR